MSWLGLKVKLAAAGAAVLAFLAMYLRLKALENQRDKAESTANVLIARHVVAKKQKKIKREEEERLVSRRADIVKEIKKEEGEFEGLDNLSDSNDF